MASASQLAAIPTELLIAALRWEIRREIRMLDGLMAALHGPEPGLPVALRRAA